MPKNQPLRIADSRRAAASGGSGGPALPAGHTHDSRYYQEAEVDALLAAGLAAKANAVHGHAAGDVAGLAEAAQDAAASLLTAAAHVGMAAAYDDAAGTLALTNTDRGSAAVATHVGAADPHAGYLLASGARAGAAAQAQRFDAGLQAIWLDKPLLTPANGSQFDDNTATYPAGWTQVNAPIATSTNFLRGFWYLYGLGTNLWKYRRQIGGMTTGSNSFVFGPVLWRLLAYPSAVTYLLGLYRDNGGAIDENTFVRTSLTYDNALGAWKVRGECKDGTTQTNSAWVQLASPLPQMPLFLRVGVYSSSTVVRAYVGTTPIAGSHLQLMSQALTAAWGTAPWLQIELAARPASGFDDQFFLGGHDRGSDS